MRSYSPEPPRNQDNSWLGRVFLVMGILFLLGMLLVFGGCSSVKDVVKWNTRVEYRDTTAWRDTTIYVPLPLEAGQVVTFAGDTAKAETSIAVAESFVDTLGRIHLDLRNKRGSLPYVISIPSRTIWVNTATEKEEIKQLLVPVEKPLSWWRKFKLASSWYLCGAVLLLLAWCTRKWWLKLIKV